MRIEMSAPTFGDDEINEAIDSLKSKNVTKGKKCAQFERDFAKYIGSKHAIMVNSGSTANLLMLAAITNPIYKDRIFKGDEIIVPALTWGTTLWPIIQMGCMPVLVDCERDTLNIDVDEVRKAITPKTRAIFIAHILGNGCRMDELVALAEERNILLIEDACESLGTTYKGKHVGSIGLMGSFSFFFSHHITTIEGGMIVTNDDELADLLRVFRAHGWTRHKLDRSIEDDYPEIDPRFMFCNLGYSVRPTEIQGAFGIHQLPKLDGFNESRKAVAKMLQAGLGHLSDYIDFTVPSEGVDHTWFGFPILLKEDKRDRLCHHLMERDIDTRPIIAGNLARHPAMYIYPFHAGKLDNADYVMERGIYIGSHPDMTDDDVAYIMKALYEFFL